ncbi:NAD(P)-dependent oxidoreductase [Entomospira nematocerorum]|uniref:NAD(P)-dependent oxidoreductase n=1 Tax=Entomospira nematocerorum TaxID=2719987 RepID=A0A968KUH7_9SPIO|nr:NAD(P)-dependent oxidoreductase [Entomospira nematocera]NIZ47284.1 NAD(P)-dependent oxidoreductase [Entomospira nematocera]WDI34174.1 NAD(P)-dependent oxidoreductase [Entomospira nematocera]
MKIGFIGLGIMGESMSENILKKHDDTLYVYDLVQSQVDLLTSKGAVATKNANELAQKSDIIISMVPKSEHSLALYKSILPELQKGKICIDMSTIDPHVSIQIAGQVEATGALFVDAPVVKSKPAAISGDLGIYVGGAIATYEMIKPFLQYMGKNIIYMGEHGKGLVMKICHNTLVAQIQTGVNETLTLAASYGIDVDTFVQAVSYGGGQNFYLDGKAKAIKNQDFTTAFSVDNMHKDLQICQAMAKEKHFIMKGQAISQEVYHDAVQAGYAQEDFSATIKVIQARQNNA